MNIVFVPGSLFTLPTDVHSPNVRERAGQLSGSRKRPLATGRSFEGGDHRRRSARLHPRGLVSEILQRSSTRFVII